MISQLLAKDHGIWLVTGAAGFIGSNVVEALLANNQRVRALDNLATGHLENITSLRAGLPAAQAQRLEFINGDVASLDVCQSAMTSVSRVIHLAALGSVPRSIKMPLDYVRANVDGFANILECARLENVAGFVYASSSSVYGDEPNLPKREDRIGAPLSPYAVSKLVNELYAQNYALCYGFKPVGMRYFNVFGPRQDPNGAYAAVVPRWVASMIKGDDITIFGDGETSRDFCFVQNVVQANLLGALAKDEARGQVYNVAVGGRLTLKDLFLLIREELAKLGISYAKEPIFADFRAGDVRHSQADITKAEKLLGYRPTHDVKAGIRAALPWYLSQAKKI